MKCLVCKEFETDDYQKLYFHIKSHKMLVKAYYDEYLRNENEGKCINCQKETKFLGLSKGYRKHCSLSCASSSEETTALRNKTMNERYGEGNYGNAKKISESWKKKTKEDYQNIVKMRRETKKIRYGDEKFTNREKFHETCREKYGVDTYTNRQLAQETCIDRYGTKDIMSLEYFQNKAKETNLVRYGVEYPILNEKIKKVIQTKTKDFYLNKLIDKIGEDFEVLQYDDENHINLKCKKCDESFWIQRQLIAWRMDQNISPCVKCSPMNQRSVLEHDLYDFIKDNYTFEIIENDRKILNGRELDIYLPDVKMAFEYNGIYWHCEDLVENNYHLKKTEDCENQGIHLIHIYEDDWRNKKEIVKSRILNLLGKSEKVFARKCNIQLVNYIDTKNFLDENHLQGYCSSKINIGLYYNNDLVSLMTLGQLRLNLGSKDVENKYELIRFCNKLNKTVIGGANKLFKYFIKEYNPIEVISYADRSWTMNNGNTLYDKLGFSYLSKTLPGYSYLIHKERKNRYHFRKDILVKQGFDPNKSEHEIMLERKIYRIYNSGNLKYCYRYK